MHIIIYACVCVCASIFNCVTASCATVCIDTCALTEANQLERGSKAKRSSAVCRLELSLSPSLSLVALSSCAHYVYAASAS